MKRLFQVTALTLSLAFGAVGTTLAQQTERRGDGTTGSPSVPDSRVDRGTEWGWLGLIGLAGLLGLMPRSRDSRVHATTGRADVR
jgi:hypothetical protein